jgi:hypothetical protein
MQVMKMSVVKVPPPGPNEGEKHGKVDPIKENL